MTSMNKNQRVVIIGANDFQNPLILKAKDMGYETHVFAWKDGSIGEKTADHFYPISIVEKDLILEKCREIQPAAVASIGSDLAAITVNYLANHLGLPCNEEITSVIATNKHAMRQAFSEAGIPVPAFCKVGVGDDLSAVHAMRLPIIVKPTDRSGSRGINKLNTLDGLEEAIAASAEVSFEKKAIVEEYIDGQEYSCECVSFNGKHHCLTVTQKFTTGAPHFIETGHLEPAPLNAEDRDHVTETVFKALDALHITNGASHTEFKMRDDGSIGIIEIGARMGGDCIGSDLVQLSTGKDFVRMTLQAALGEEPDMQVHEHYKNSLIRFVFNRSDAERLEWIHQHHPEYLVRQSAIELTDEKNVVDSSTRCGFYILAGDDAEVLKELAQL